MRIKFVLFRTSGSFFRPCFFWHIWSLLLIQFWKSSSVYDETIIRHLSFYRISASDSRSGFCDKTTGQRDCPPHARICKTGKNKGNFGGVDSLFQRFRQSYCKIKMKEIVVNTKISICALIFYGKLVASDIRL